MKKRNGMALGAAALFAFTGCVVDLAFAEESLQQVVNAHFSAVQDFGGGQEQGQDMGGGPAQDPGQGNPGQVDNPGQDGPWQGGKPWPTGQCPSAQNPPGPGGQCPQPPPPPVCKESSPLPPAPKPGECYARCITPAVFATRYDKLQICAPCPIPSVTPGKPHVETVPVVVKKAAEGLKIPASTKKIKQVQVSPEYTEYTLVKPAQWGKKKIPTGFCTDGYICTPKFHPEKEWVYGPVYTKPVPIPPPPLESHTVTVLVKDKSTKWVRKPGNCSPEDIKNGLTDCDTICLEIIPAVYKQVTVKECPGKDGKGCNFIDRPMRPKKLITVLVPGPLDCAKPGPCEFKIIDVMLTPPQYDVVTVPAKHVDVEVCENGKPEVFPIPAETKNIPFTIYEYQKQCTPVPPVYDCIPVKYQVCDPVMVWRQVLCEDKVTDSKLITVQKALAQEGFYQGQIDGSLNDQTQQALREYQKAKGLPQGGGLTIETLESLGIYE